MQIRCTSCTRTIALDAGGELPDACPHCRGACLPRQLGPFVPLRLVATGGMGEVYLARHAELGTEVALKLLPAMPPAAAASVRERFAREARLTARVQHPGVVKVLDDDVAGDRPYLVLEFVDGETLRQALRNGPLPVVQAARLAALTADVLAAAHQGGVLHRDVKPDNVMLARDGSVRVLDFGIARAMADDAPLTRTGEILGTPEYMAPEQLLDGPEATDERTDVHALGVLLYELLTARSPFRGSNLFQALKLVESLVPGPPSSLRAEVPQALDAVVLRALQKRREDRYDSAAAFAAAVRSAVPEAAEPEQPAARSPWRSPLLVAALFAVATAGFVLAQAMRDVPRSLGGALTDAATAFGEAAAHAATTATLAHQHLADGQWCAALVHAQRGLDDGDHALLPIAQDAFLLAHLAWPLAVDLPPWLGCCDERQRQRLFGTDSEPPAPADPLAHARLLLGRGEYRPALALLQEHAATPTADARDRRLLLLAAHLVGADAATLRSTTKKLALESDPASRLLAVRLLPSPARAAAFTDFAALAPIEQPERWLALRCAQGYRIDGDRKDANHCAEMAWLQGAGELTVLLDVGIRVLSLGGTTAGFPPGDKVGILLMRLAGSDVSDSPATLALLASLALTDRDPANGEQILASALPANAPASMSAFQQWLAAAKAHDAPQLALHRGLAAWRVRAFDGRLEAARAAFANAATPTGKLCSFLLDAALTAEHLPDEVPPAAFAIVIEFVRGNSAQIPRLLAAAAARPNQSLQYLRLAVLAGAEVDFAEAPWRAFAEGAERARFDDEVNGGLTR